jgi:hypothetical protein
MEQAYLHETGVDVAVIHKFDYSVPPLHAEVYKKCTINPHTAAAAASYVLADRTSSISCP